MRSDTTPGSLYYAIKDARNAARTAERQLLADPEAAPPDWKPVLQQAVKALTEKTRDLEIVAYLIEALVRLHGYVGLRDGFRLARELIEKYWDDLYPLPDEEGIDTKVAPLTGLNGADAEGTLIMPIYGVPVTDSPNYGKLSASSYQEALALNKITDPKVREKRLSSGALTLDTFNRAVGETAPKFYTALLTGLNQAIEEFSRLCQALDKRCDGRAPPSSNIRGALTTCQDLIRNVAKAKLEAAAAAPAKQEGAPSAGPAAPEQPPGEVLEVIRNREDAFRALLKIADYFRRTEPQAILSYTIEQVVRWGRMPLPELLQELIPDEAPRKGLFKQVGIRPPEPPKDAKK